MATTVLLTAADLAEIPEDQRGELIDGVMQPMAPVQGDHADTVGKLQEALGARVRPGKLGRLGPERGFTLRTNPDTVLAPDISFVARERDVDDADVVGFPRIAPDLAVEVVSPNDRFSEIEERIAIYLQAGVRLLWIVDPQARRVTVHTPDQLPRRLGPADTLDGNNVLPGFALPLADLFDLD